MVTHRFKTRYDGWKQFGLRRIVRIVPLYWSLLTLKVATLLLVIALKFRVDPLKLVGGVFAVLCLMAFFRAPHWPAAAFYFDTIVLEFGFGMLIALLRQPLERWSGSLREH